MSDWKLLWPYGLGALGVLVVVLYLGKKFAEVILEKLADRAFSRVASGPGILHRSNIRRYRDAVLAADNKQATGFLQGVSLDVLETFVPTRYTEGGERRDLFVNLLGVQRAVVVGSAGAGKSMFLHYWLLRWAQAPSEISRIPVLVDLHLYKVKGGSLRELVVDKLQQRGMRDADSKLDAALQVGRLTLLLDGLDEVVTDRRDSLVGEIRGFAEQFATTQIIVTCRDAVYSGQLGPAFEHKAGVADFDDADIRRFLRQWFKYQPIVSTAGEAKTATPRGHVLDQVEQLIAELHASTGLYRLARNPLMLTMIASLQDADPGDGSLLSGSRADFYELAIDHMLKRDHAVHRLGGIATFRSGHKEQMLKRIALAAQGADSDTDSDRRAITEQEILEQMEPVAVRHRLEDKSRAILDEIVTRSELLLCIDDNNLLYEFRHATLQEYLAAKELGVDWERLLNLYLARPGRWRETVKLWCAGSNIDCSELVDSIFGGDAADKLLALECLAEARDIDESVARLIVKHFVDRNLGDGDPHQSLILAAIGAVAANQTSWGRHLLAHLREQVTQARSAPTRVAAMQALTATRLPVAIEILSQAGDPDARAALRSMGEQVIPILARRGRDGDLDAIDDIAAIATAAAATALAELLGGDSLAAQRAAWHLASLTDDPYVVDGLRRNIPQLPAGLATDLWVWAPFAGTDAAFTNVMARTAYLIRHSADYPPVDHIDARVGIPVAMVSTGMREAAFLSPASGEDDMPEERELRSEMEVRYNVSTSKLLLMASRSQSASLWQSAARVSDAVLRRARVARRERWLISLLHPPVRFTIASHMIESARIDVSERDWTNVRQNVKEPTRLSEVLIAMAIGAPVIFMAPGLVRLGASIFGFWPWGPAIVQWLGVAAVVLATAAAILPQVVKDDKIPGGEWYAWTVLGLIVVAGLMCLTYTLVTYSEWIGWYWAGGAFLATMLALLAVGTLYARRSRMFENPLREILAAAEPAAEPETT